MDSLTFLRDMDRLYRWLTRRRPGDHADGQDGAHASRHPFPIARACHVVLVDGTTIKGVLLRDDRKGVELANAQVAAPNSQAFSDEIEGRILVLAARINYMQLR